MKKILIILLFLFPGVASSDVVLEPGQTYNTGNIVQPTTTSSGSTWINGVYQNQLTCWAGGDPGYCGPNPIVRHDGSINYSYGWVDLYQQQLVANVLPYSGTGLRVNGYNFNFMAKNGNGWDDGRTDLLFAYVQFDGPNGTILNNTSNLSYSFNWSRITLDQTFATPYATSEITSVRYGFVGKDNNGWAGPYGPEIYDVNFSLRYSVDPCATNPLYSPTCPGYLQALAELTTIPSVVLVEPNMPIELPSIEPSRIESNQPSTQQMVSAPSSNTQTSQTVSSTTPNTQSNEQSSGGSVSLSSVLSMINKNQDREKSIANNAVQNALSEAAAATEKTEKEALAISSIMTTMSNATSVLQEQNDSRNDSNKSTSNENNSMSVVNILGSSASSNMNNLSAMMNSINTISSDSSVELNKSPEVTSTVSLPTENEQMTQNINVKKEEIQSTENNTNLGQGLQVNVLSINSISNIQEIVIPSIELYVPPAENKNTGETESFNTPSLNFTDKTNPVNDVIEGKVLADSEKISDNKSAVNTNVQPNELAGNTGIERLGIGPENFAAYTNFTLKDANFYEPKEVYKNQVVIDNRRALRQLASDRLHKEMVEMQYKGENK